MACFSTVCEILVVVVDVANVSCLHMSLSLFSFTLYYCSFTFYYCQIKHIYSILNSLSPLLFSLLRLILIALLACYRCVWHLGKCRSLEHDLLKSTRWKVRMILNKFLKTIKYDIGNTGMDRERKSKNNIERGSKIKWEG